MKTKKTTTTTDFLEQYKILSGVLSELEIQIKNNKLILDDAITQQKIEMYKELGTRRLELQAYISDNNTRLTRIVNQFNKLANDYELTKKTAVISLIFCFVLFTIDIGVLAFFLITNYYK